jgi:hypothetical protein
MLENEFEKQVQQKMKEFDLLPSEEVWMGVERRIREEKKRRFIFWWPLLFLLVGGGIAAGILFANKKEKKGEIAAKNKTENSLQSPVVNSIVPQAKKNLNSINKNDTAGNLNETAVRNKDNNVTAITSDNGTKIRLSGNKPAGKETVMIKKQQANKPDMTKENFVKTEKQKKYQNKPSAVPIIVAKKPTNDLTDSTKFSFIAVEGKKEKQQKNNQEPAQLITDSINKHLKDQLAVNIEVPLKAAVDLKDSVKVIDIAVEENKELQQKNHQEPAAQTTDSISKEQKAKRTDKKSEKWDWGITFSGGRSTVNSFRFFENPLLPADAAALANYRRSRSLNASSSAWAAGVYAKRSVSKKLDLNIGLGYSYLSTKVNVGSRVDSVRNINNPYSGALAINNFYRPSTTADNLPYTNQYHFMSLSGELSWRIITGKKIKVYWENGLSYNRLLSSTMLHYDASLTGYYKDNRLLNRNHIFFSTGFSIPVSERLMINPFVSYGLTPVLKNTNSQRTNFTNFGIHVRILLNRK